MRTLRIVNFVLLFFLCLFSVLAQKTDRLRVPEEKYGNYILFKNDSIKVSYFWEEIDLDEGMPLNVFKLNFVTENLSHEIIFIKYILQTHEDEPNKITTLNDLDTYGYEKILPSSNRSVISRSNCGEIVDFKIIEFFIKDTLGKKINIANKLNKEKRYLYKRIEK